MTQYLIAMDFKIFMALFVFSALFMSCVPESDFSLAVRNDTDDTLIMFVNSDTGNFLSLNPQECIDFFPFEGNPYKVEKKKDYYLHNIIDYNYHSVDFGQKDSVVIHWNGKMYHGGKTIHDFYNYESWEIKDEEKIKKYLFTVQQTDY